MEGVLTLCKSTFVSSKYHFQSSGSSAEKGKKLLLSLILAYFFFEGKIPAYFYYPLKDPDDVTKQKLTKTEHKAS
jgi:hypothetical protein